MENSGRPAPSFIQEAFQYWQRTLLFQVAFSVIFLLMMGLGTYALAQQFGIWEQLMSLSTSHNGDVVEMQRQLMEISRQPAFGNFSLALIILSALMYPLNIGLYHIFKKLDLGEEPVFSDLFAGYRGTNFFAFATYYLFWYFVYSFAVQTVILGIFWVFVTLFGAPLMFFHRKTIFETTSLSFKALRVAFAQIFLGILVAVIVKYAGIFTCVGAIFTLPFFNAVIYVLYKKIFSDQKI